LILRQRFEHAIGAAVNRAATGLSSLTPDGVRLELAHQ
jgi:hypothetical protein